MPRPSIVTVLVASLCFAPPSHAAHSYDSCTGFIDSLPATIATQGVWCLRKDLNTANTSGNAITISTNNVTIDCNDHKIGGLAAGAESQAVGIFAASQQNATIRHCSVRGFHSGIFLQSGAGHLVEDNRLDNNLKYGIYVSGDNNRIRRNGVYDTGGASGSSSSTAIYAYANIVDNDIQGVFALDTPSYPTGIGAYGYVVSGNRISGLELNTSGEGAGYAVGITGFSNTTSAVGNQVLARSFQVAGVGINSVRFCANNTVASFATPYSYCGSSIGNLP